MNQGRAGSSHHHIAGYEFFMLVLSVYAIGVLAAQTLIHMDPEVSALLDHADNAVCALFFLDFVLSMWRAENRWRYFITWGWIDLLSSIPTLDPTRWGRLARIFRILRLLRGLRAAKVMVDAVTHRRTHSGVLAAALAGFFLVISSAVAVLIFESGGTGTIKTGEDALWWALVTVTTVGYGDFYPVTTEGRIVAVVLMFGGVGLFGVFSGLLAAWFIQPGKAIERADLEAIEQELVRLRQAIERLAPPAPPPADEAPSQTPPRNSE